MLHQERSMEEWGYIDVRDLEDWKGGEACMTLHRSTYGTDQFNERLVYEFLKSLWRYFKIC